MRRITMCCIFIFLFLVLISVPAHAEDEEVGAVNQISFGLGTDWGGLGFNYIGMPDDSDIGLSLGCGFVGVGVGGSACVVIRLNRNETALFAGYGGAAVMNAGAGSGPMIHIGNLPTGAGEFLWRVGIGSYNGDYFPVGGIGVSM